MEHSARIASNTDVGVADDAILIRQLALVDKALGLEAELARVSIANVEIDSHRHEIDSHRHEIDHLHADITRLRDELNSVYGSRTWRIGTAALSPVRKARAFVRARSAAR